jgi:hypothetical protein
MTAFNSINGNTPHNATAAVAPISVYAESKLGKRVLWAIALAPLLGYLIRAFLIGCNAPDYQSDEAFNAYMRYMMANGDFWYVTLILNLALTYFDFRKLQHEGVDVSAFGRASFVVPVYLYRRAKLLGHPQVAMWTWIGIVLFLELAVRVG